ncbi:MAG: hypothetical protein D6744_12295 [Planctomycetota bacterium]|nr:MAG: hypothetical protein D6744_12295 [Planctomycetota bacterium]
MPPRHPVIPPALLIAACLAAVPAALAQELFFVTGVSREGLTQLTGEDGETRPLLHGSVVTPGAISIEPGGQLMMFEDSGVVVLALGPAQLTLSEVQGDIEIELAAGKLMVAADGEDLRTILVRTAFDDSVAEIDVVPGRTFVVRQGADVEVAYQGAESQTVYVGEDAHEFGDGQRVVLRPSGIERAALDGWLAAHDFGKSWGESIGVSSATAARGDVERDLFRNIVQWDRRGGASYVAAEIRSYRFNPEIRQVVQTISAQQRQTSRGTEIRTQPFDAANEVPTLSPAALSVQNRNIAEGVTVITLNSRAGALLTNTGSQGLGFRGPSRLAIPGLLGGLRTVGPAGLGAQP